MINKIKQIHEKKLRNLSVSPLSAGLSVDKVILNHSNRILTASESKKLLLGLDFGLLLRKVNFNKYYLYLKNCFYNCKIFIFTTTCLIPNRLLNLYWKQCVTNVFILLSLVKFHSISTNSDFRTLKTLSQDKSIYDTKPDKVYGVVILNRSDYDQKVYSVINDSDKFEEIHVDKKKSCLLNEKIKWIIH